MNASTDLASSKRAEPPAGEDKVHPRQITLLVPPPLNPCPVCGAETTLAEIERHPLHVNFEIHGYLCSRCGPIKSLVVLRSRRPGLFQWTEAPRCRNPLRALPYPPLAYSA